MNKIVQEVQNKYSFLNNLLTKLWRSWFKSNITFKLHLRNVRWKNDKATPDCAYQPTKVRKHILANANLCECLQLLLQLDRAVG